MIVLYSMTFVYIILLYQNKNIRKVKCPISEHTLIPNNIDN